MTPAAMARPASLGAALADQFTLELGDGGEHGHQQAGCSERIELRERKGFSDFWSPAAFISGREPLDDSEMV